MEPDEKSGDRTDNRPHSARTDPRLIQIGLLGALLGGGAYFRDFSIKPEQAVLCFAAGILTQSILDGYTESPRRSLLSAVITCLSLSLLLRADNAWAHPAAAILAIGSKFAIRTRNNKHLFNPANFGVIAGLTLLPGTWVSAGQWGHDVAITGWMLAAGCLIVNRARRSDVSLCFLLAYSGALMLRVMWLGQRWAVLTHQLNNGALLLFTFFMISDPMTAPNGRRGRLAHAALNAAAAYVWQFDFHLTNGLLWARFLSAFAVPLWDAIWPVAKYEWSGKGEHGEKVNETQTGSD